MRTKPRLLLLVAAVLLGSGFLLAQGTGTGRPSEVLSKQWKHVRSAHFEAVGNASEGELRRSLDDLEAFRNALATFFPGIQLDSPVPMTIIVFRDEQSFRRFRPRDSRGRPQDGVAGYFMTGADANYIVFHAYGIGTHGAGRYGNDYTRELVFHEFTHHVMYNSFQSLPLWLNEGIAEFFSTFRRQWKDGRSLIGVAPAGRLGALAGGFLVPLAQIVSPREMQKMWNNPRRIGLFYAESWALVHYLITARGQANASALSDYVRAMEKTGSAESAFEQVFETDLKGMEREMQIYVRQFAFNALTLPQPRTEAAVANAERMPEADVRQLQGTLLLEHGAFDQAEQEFDAALALDPAHERGRIERARLAVARDRRPEGVALLQEVARSSPSSFAAQYYLGAALAEDWQHEAAMASFERAFALNPKASAALRGLSMCALALGRQEESDQRFEEAMRIERTPALHRERALDALAYGRDATAAAEARTYITRVGWSEEDAQYTGLIGGIAYRRSGQAAEADAMLAEVEEAVPPKSWTAAVVQFMRGRLDAAALLSKAKGAGEKTEAHTYIGLMQATAGQRDEALAHLRWVAAQGAKNYVEYAIAKRELERLARSAMTK